MSLHTTTSAPQAQGDLPRGSAGAKPSRKHTFNFTQKSAISVKIRHSTSTSWLYFPDIHAAACFLTKKRHFNAEISAELSLARTLETGAKRSDGILVEKCTLQDVMNEEACEHFVFREIAPPHRIFRNTSWATAHADASLQLDKQYSCPGTLGRAIKKKLAGNNISGLAAFDLTHVHTKEVHDEGSWEKALGRTRIEYGEPFLIGKPNQAAAQGTRTVRQQPCAHRCLNKRTCLHPCCKVGMEPELTNNRPQEPGGHAPNRSHPLPRTTDEPTPNHESRPSRTQPCAHRCLNKRICLHQCCKISIDPEPMDHPSPHPDMQRADSAIQKSDARPDATPWLRDEQTSSTCATPRRSCKHICQNKQQCKHMCCKIGVKIDPRRLESLNEETTVIATPPSPAPRTQTPPDRNLHHITTSEEQELSRRPCKHVCRNKAECKHQCCKEGVLSRPQDARQEPTRWSLRNLFSWNLSNNETNGQAPAGHSERSASSEPQRQVETKIGAARSSPRDQRHERRSTNASEETRINQSPRQPAHPPVNNVTSEPAPTFGTESNTQTLTQTLPPRGGPRQTHGPNDSTILNSQRNRSRNENILDTETAEYLLSTMRTIEGGRVMISLSQDQWQLAIKKAMDRCKKYLKPASTPSEALLHTELLTACMSRFMKLYGNSTPPKGSNCAPKLAMRNAPHDPLAMTALRSN